MTGSNKVTTIRRLPILTTFTMTSRVETVELLANAGFDAALFDLEHAPITIADLPMLAAACGAAEIVSLVRSMNHEPSTLSVILDCGVDGVIVPHVGSGSDARAIVDACRYPPVGGRSINPYVRGLAYGRLDAQDRRPLVLAMVEGSDGLANAHDILETDGLDGIFIGPFDLAASLGLPGQPEHASVVNEIEQLLQAAAAIGSMCGVYAHTVAAARRWLKLGASLVALSTDTAFMARAFSEAVDQTRS